MQLLKIENVWFADSWSAQAIFWTIAIISTLLLVILLVYSLFSEEEEPVKQNSIASFLRLDARTVLLFFTAFGWAATIASYFPNSFVQMLFYGILAGTGVAVLVSLWSGIARKLLPGEQVITSTARVMRSIPPHRAGIGKVFLNASRVPVELDAITIGRELPVGAPVRIIEMLDDHTAVVEPLDSRPGGANVKE